MVEKHRPHLRTPASRLAHLEKRYKTGSLLALIEATEILSVLDGPDWYWKAVAETVIRYFAARPKTGRGRLGNEFAKLQAALKHRRVWAAVRRELEVAGASLNQAYEKAQLVLAQEGMSMSCPNIRRSYEKVERGRQSGSDELYIPGVETLRQLGLAK